MSREDRDDLIRLEGVVIEAMPGTLFKVEVHPGNAIVNATLAGKMRKNRIRILPDDKVQLEVSPYDLTRGRITRRL